jgi:Thioesterase domain/Phosphopantetheine attachment site
LLPAPGHARSAKRTSPLNQRETQIRKVWADVLGLPEEAIGCDDDFFEIGGNSILVIRLVSRLNQEFGIKKLSIADVFVHRTIRLQSLQLLRRVYEGVSMLNSTSQNPCMFMIHPANAGSEVYMPLAGQLEGQIQCFGVDSYNLHSALKIDSLHELAAIYLNEIDDIMKTQKQRTYSLFGWSLGGHIALEIAAILESRGIRDIEVCLLDTVMSDERLASMSGEMSPEDLKRPYIQWKKQDGYDDSYIDTFLENFETDMKLGEQPISRKLKWTKVLLFKALSRCEHDNEIESPMHNYVASLEFNNIERIHQDVAHLRKIVLADSDHFNILKQENKIIEALINWTDLI